MLYVVTSFQETLYVDLVNPHTLKKAEIMTEVPLVSLTNMINGKVK